MNIAPLIHLIVGARPNFVKAAPVLEAFKRANVARVKLIHTGQHYDANLSDVFFEELELPRPDTNLSISGGSHTEQTARIMLAYEPVWNADIPDAVIVVGDVNSTLACALVAKKCGGKVVHLEAGLRSNDLSMPEEINRIAVDAVSDLLLCPSKGAYETLKKEGHSTNKIAFVGNVMIDTLMKFRGSEPVTPLLSSLGLTSGGYVVVTLHRPFNVDTPEKLEKILFAIHKACDDTDIVMPVHPRTLAQMEYIEIPSRIIIVPPLGYKKFLTLIEHALAVVTDSGGIQEETSVLGVPCLTLRPNTERPITIALGTNKLVTLETLEVTMRSVFGGHWPQATEIPLWDGNAASRVVEAVHAILPEI